MTGRGRLPAPSALNILACAITAGDGAFTCGVRLGDAGAGGDLDQNCNDDRLEGLWIADATDESGGPQAPLREGCTAVGVLVPWRKPVAYRGGGGQSGDGGDPEAWSSGQGGTAKRRLLPPSGEQVPARLWS